MMKIDLKECMVKAMNIVNSGHPIRGLRSLSKDESGAMEVKAVVGLLVVGLLIIYVAPNIITSFVYQSTEGWPAWANGLFTVMAIIIFVGFVYIATKQMD
jgi:membrane protein YdbS with pleckstrin-like domain